jgi:hypothetical protein
VKGLPPEGRFVFFGDNVGGNNVAEAMSLKALLLWMIDGFRFTRGEVVEVVGDNKLCVQFMRREARPRLRQLVPLVDECKLLLRKLPCKVLFFHVRRMHNVEADFLS